MSKKIELGREGKLRPMLKGLFKKYVAKKMEESSRKMAYYFRLFPFLKDWVVDEKEAELILRYYGYLDKNEKVILNPKKETKNHAHPEFWDEEDYWDEYEEIYPGPSEDDSDDEEEENIYSELYPDVGEYWNNLESGGKKKVRTVNTSIPRIKRLGVQRICLMFLALTHKDSLTRQTSQKKRVRVL